MLTMLSPISFLAKARKSCFPDSGMVFSTRRTDVHPGKRRPAVELFSKGAKELGEAQWSQLKRGPRSY